MIKTHKRVNSMVDFFYPTHGTSNVLRRVKGVVVAKKIGPNGPYLAVTEESGSTKCFLTKKIVQF